MDELNFCPSCDAPKHKLMHCKGHIFYCKECTLFFSYDPLTIPCTFCKGKLVKSDFDSPSGGAVFMCTKCKKTFPAKELLEGVA